MKLSFKNLLLNSNLTETENVKTSKGNGIAPKHWHNIVRAIDRSKNDSNKCVLDSSHSYSEYNSILLNSSNCECSTSNITLMKDHVYYLFYYTFTSKNSIYNMFFRNGTDTIKVHGTNNSIPGWIRNNTIYKCTENISNFNIQFKSNCENEIYLDAFCMIDLTESFGTDTLPELDWLKLNIPYFKNTYELEINNNVKILNKHDFIQDSETGIYYNNNDIVEIEFSIKDFKAYDNEDSIKPKFIFRYNLFYHNDYTDDITTILQYGMLGFTADNIIDIKDDYTYFSIPIKIHDYKNVYKIECQIIERTYLENNIYNDTIKDIFTWRCTHPYTEFTCKCDENDIDERPVITTSTYMKKITGTYNPRIYAPSKVNIYVNNNLIPGIIRNINDYENCTFEKEVYLFDGENNIDVEVIDICGEIYKKSFKVNVDIMTYIYKSETFLTNFIGNDDQMINVNLNDLKLEYENKNSGFNKPIIYNGNEHRYFSLEGINSQYYKLDKKYKPAIQSSIIRKPIAVYYDSVEKIYDGDNDITSAFKSFKLHDGYYFSDTKGRPNEFTNIGFNNGTSQRKTLITDIYEKDNIIDNTYELQFAGITLDGINIMIDGIEGNSYYNENTSQYEFKLNHNIEYNETAITKNHALNIINGKSEEEGMFYSKEYLVSTTINGETKKIRHILVIDNRNELIYRDFYGDYKPGELIPIAKRWLEAIDHKIYSITLSQYNENEYEEDKTIINFNYIEDEELYTVKDKVTITYNYKETKEEDDRFIFELSDNGKLELDYTSANFDIITATKDYIPINISGLKLIGGELGDESKNYQLSTYTAWGKILPRPVYITLKALDKIYDGSNYVPFEYIINNIIEKKHLIGTDFSHKDDIYIDNRYDINNDGIVEVGESFLTYNDPNIGINKIIQNTPKINIKGLDAFNYYIHSIDSNYLGNVLKREVTVTITELRYIIASKTFEVEYEFDNVISGENLQIVHATGSAADLIVYGGKNIKTNEDLSELTNYNGIVTLQDLFFNYENITSYEFEKYNTADPNDETNEVYVVDKENDNDTYYAITEKIPAKPGVLRNDSIATHNKSSVGEIQLIHTDVLANEQAPYYESQDRQYRIRSGDQVMIKNINMLSNEFSINYTLLTTEQKIAIQII